MDFLAPRSSAFWPTILHLQLIPLFSIIMLCSGMQRNETDRLALLEFKSMISNDPYDILNSWNDSVNFCQWQGVNCSRKHHRVTSLNLQGLNLVGAITPHLANLTFLRILHLGGNRFHGEIPREVGHLFRLRYLILSNNSLEGEIPFTISNCSELKSLDLVRNRLVGRIPDELGLLKKLVNLDLLQNNLTGEIPHSFGNLSFLEDLRLTLNHIQGKIPNELGQLTTLINLGIAANNLTGEIPFSLYNISSISSLFTAVNPLEGSIPSNIGLTLPNLQILGMAYNGLTGNIPVSLTNATQLRMFDFTSNNLSGKIPTDWGNLKGLQQIHVEFNLLGSNTNEDLNFLTSLANCSNLVQLYFDGNNLGGVLPWTITNLSTLHQLGFGRNQLSGRIPTEIENLVNLFRLDMDGNLFSGSIPSSFGKLQKLERLTLNENELSGEIPPSIGNMSKLYRLQLEGNKLEGNITPSLGNCKNLRFLDISRNNLIGTIPEQIFALPLLSDNLNLSHNSLTGLLPSEVGKLKNVNALDVSENKLSGEIPRTIGDCSRLEILKMQGNSLQGPLPLTFASLKGLQQLDLSRNNLSGNIPKELGELFSLQLLNLSYNNLSGEVPKEGVFNSESQFSLRGNSNLCGGIPGLLLPACPVKQKRNSSLTTIVLAAIGTSIVLIVTITYFCVSCWRKSRKNPSSTTSIMETLPRISYKELLQATEGFSSDNVIGQGSFGSVYRGILDRQGRKLVAVKVLNLQQHGASKSFLAECRALKNIRHRNLIKILTYCSSIDFKGKDFKALVFDFMANGSLEMWLHPEPNGNRPSTNLSLVQRLRVAVDVASALNYLHDDCETPIVHCDLKPSNILLDNDMVAHVGDFGLARLLSESANTPQSQSFSTGMKGTIGYMAPEYGMGSKATTYGDVYSFGIILLEMFTGRRPTDEMFTNGIDLHNFVKALLPKQVTRAVDPTLYTTREMGIEIKNKCVQKVSRRTMEDNVKKCIVSVLQIGLACSVEAPRDRMKMMDVSIKLNAMADDFLSYNMLSPNFTN